MYPREAENEIIIETGIRYLSLDDEITIASNSTVSSSDDSCSSSESLYELGISRLLAFHRSGRRHSTDSKTIFDPDCSEITEQEYSTEESCCDTDDDLDIPRTLVTEEADPSDAEISSRSTRRKLQVVGVCVAGVCVAIPSLLLLLDPQQADRSKRR
ncbi:unnamed protein product [Cylindrotheca closterium]|uniref:Uncharacterized protein n=1 Tax=Cylindrotheca closterium TaxID=2856 RepID=A0AAD2CRN6_9STRA|nr:unnamed protein product [Cylindrotheca closterium]